MLKCTQCDTAYRTDCITKRGHYSLENKIPGDTKREDGTPYTAFSPVHVLAETARIAMKNEECEDAMIFLLFHGHGMGKRAPSGGGQYSLRGTLFSSEYCPGRHYSWGGHDSLRKVDCLGVL